MKLLRILTGLHAGTELLLEPSTLCISAQPDADLQISDWTDEPLILQIDASKEDMNNVTITIGPNGSAQLMEDFVPLRFADIVLCIGSALRQAWPPDVQLMQRLLASPRPDARSNGDAHEARPHTIRPWLFAAAATLVAALGGAFYLVVSASARSAEQRDEPSLLARAMTAIERSQASGVNARSSHDQVIVEGLLPSATDVARLRAELAGLPGGAVQHRYASAADIAQNIAEALVAPGLRVRHVRNGEFLVEGEAVHAAALQPAADRLINDLAPLVQSIRVQVKNLPPPAKTPTGAMLQIPSMEYVQTRDGTKHISMPSLPTQTDPGPEPGPTLRAIAANKE
jgi:type III secretion protein D